MPVSDLHREVAGVALRAAARYGFALGGGNALIAHGVIDRPTEDIDLFTDREHGVAAAADAVEAALRQAGYTAERQDKTAGLADVFYGMGDGLAEWVITTPGGAQLLLQMAYFDRGRQPVLMEIGPVLTWMMRSAARSPRWRPGPPSATTSMSPPPSPAATPSPSSPPWPWTWTPA